jgi:hypothetical protein
MIFSVTSRRVRAGMALAFAVAAGPGCSSSSEVPEPHKASDLTLPLDAYDLGAQDRAQVLQARFALVKECMEHFRLELEVPPIKPVVDAKNAGYLAWLDEGDAERYGYAGAPGRADEDQMTGMPVYAITDVQRYVLDGKIRRLHGVPVPPGGCMAKVDGILNQGAKGVPAADIAKRFNDKQLAVLAEDASALAYKDARIATAERSWSDCMEDAGFTYRTTVAAAGDPRWASTAADDQLEKLRGTEVEIETAVADARCRRETNYSGVRQAVYTDYQNQIIGRQRSRLDAFKALNQARVANAAKYRNGEIRLSW